MQVFLRILKEIGISVIILGILVVGIVFLFKDQFFFLRSSVPNPIVYNGIDENKFSVDGSIEDLKDPAKIYQSTNTELRTYEDEHRVKTGLSNPFNATGLNSSVADIPNEKVTIRNNATFSYSGDFIDLESYYQNGFVESNSSNTEEESTEESSSDTADESKEETKKEDSTLTKETTSGESSDSNLEVVPNDAPTE